MAKVTIGGEEIDVDLPNFKALKAAWKYIAVAQGNADPMVGVDAIMGVIAVGKIGDPITVDQLEERMKPSEMAGLRSFMNQLLIDVGLAKPPGEAAPAGETAENPSTETLAE